MPTLRLSPWFVVMTLAEPGSCCGMQVQFGELFFGESATRCLTLVNNGPTEACFDLSFGSMSDLKALLSGGPDDDVMSGSQDDRLAAFLQVARIRVSQPCS